VELLAYLRRHYATQLQERYKLEVDPALSDEELLAQLGRKRGAMLSGGRVNLQKAAEILMYEFRQGTLGRITLETPPEFDQWQQRAEIAEQQRLAQAAERKRLRRSG
jgi:ribosome biogenesis GTPase A